MIRLKSLAPVSILVLALAAGPALAQEVNIGDVLGSEIGAIATTLKERGYDVRKTEREEGEIELYAVREGRRFEIYVDPANGAVTRVKEKH